MGRNLKGAMPPKRDIRDYVYSPAGGTQVPESFSLGPVTIKNQGQVNSCVAHTAAEILEYLNKQLMSVGFIYGTRYEYKGQGMYLRDALKTMQKIGDSNYIDFPYNLEVPKIIDKVESTEFDYEQMKNFIIDSYYQIDPKDVNLIKQALFSNDCPLMASVYWQDGFQVDKEGIIYNSGKKDGGYHCIMIYGWNEKGFLIQNSWGEHWGDNGCAILPYNIPLAECWGIIDTTRADNKTKEDIYIPVVKSDFDKILIKIVNFILGLLDKFKNLC